MPPKTLVITGASGFIGRHAAVCAAGQGYTVVGIGHGDWRPSEWRAWGLSAWHRADVTIDNLASCAKDPRAILHVAGSASVAFSLAKPLDDYERNVTTTARVLEYVRQRSPSTRVVYASSAAVYGTVGCLPISEEARRAPISPYGVHKSMAEQLIQSYARQFSVSSAIVRFFSVYGCGLRKQLLWDACCKLAGRNNDFQGTGREVRDWLHVEDAARLMLIAVERADPLCPIANGGSGVGLTVREILSHISIAMDVDGQEPRFSGEERGGDPCALVASICRAKEWGWSPEKPWRNEVGEYVAWWRHTGRYLAESPNGIDRQSLAG